MRVDGNLFYTRQIRFLNGTWEHLCGDGYLKEHVMHLRLQNQKKSCVEKAHRPWRLIFLISSLPSLRFLSARRPIMEVHLLQSTSFATCFASLRERH
jgi:hypothetical protein